MEVVYVNRMLIRLLCKACREIPLARISWFRTSVQYRDWNWCQFLLLSSQKVHTWFGVYTKEKIHPNKKMDIIPTPEIALEGTSFTAVAAATCDDIAATRDSAAARLKDPQTNLDWLWANVWKYVISCAEIGLTLFSFRSSHWWQIQRLLQNRIPLLVNMIPPQRHRERTIEEAKVSSNFLLTEVTPTAANMVGRKTWVMSVSEARPYP